MAEIQPDYHYLERLNHQQREAVEYLDGPELVIAGAGSGKTRVLTYKIVHLLNNGYAPRQILALTFTNKAAREMKDRVAELMGTQVAGRLWMGTFHSVFLRILRAYAERIGFKSSFSIYDASDSRNLVKLIIKELALNDKIYKAPAVAATISNAKNAMMTSIEYERRYADLDRKAKRPMISEIFRIYEERCRVANAMDFDDILFYMNILLRDHEDVRAVLANQFRYILVDEYQDTNFAQHMVVKQLAAPKNMICVVGDDAQSIYSFRGANIGNIIDLEHEYPNLKTFKLERNYRSTKNIVNASASLIEKNSKQLKKNVFSENDEGSPVEIAETYSDLEEAAIVAAYITKTRQMCHDSFEDYAILYRTNAQSRVLEEALRKRNIGYRIYGGTAFYQRKEVKDAVAYFRMVINPDDDEALRRIINYPARGIGETTMKKVQAAAIASQKSLWSVLMDPAGAGLSVTTGTLKKLNAFVDLITGFITDNDRADAYEIGQIIFNRTGILTVLAHDNTPENISRRENLRELLKGMKEFVDGRVESGEEDISLRTFLSEVMLATDQDINDTSEDPKVTMMTAHAAKGLEFKHVCIVGVEEELFPSAMAMDTISQVEEERRLLYVAMTRAKESCMLSYAKSRFRNGQTSMTSPSRFLSELDPRFIKWDGGGFKAYPKTTYKYTDPVDNYYRSSLSDSGQYRTNSSRSVSRDNYPSGKRPVSSVQNRTGQHSVSELKIGMKIEHNSFGIGKIIKFSRISGQDSIIVDFGASGIKKLLLAFAKFNILN